MLLNLGQLAIGLVVVTLGASWLVKGASRLALRFGIPPLIIGLTVVAFGTSAPELAVSITSALAGQSDLAVANVVGSNIFNVLFILGLSALITPLVVHQQLVRMDLPVMIGMSMLLYVLTLDGGLDLVDSVLLVGLIVGYTVFLLREARRQGAGAESKDATLVPGKLPFNIALLVAGLVCLVLGSNVMVTGAVGLARLLGVSETVIGLTIVAAGTSLPEVATSVTAAIKGERDIAIGNVVGSNIFNIGSVLGFSGLASLGTLTISPAMMALDVPVMLAVSMLCLPFFRTGYQLTRFNGAALMAGQVGYVAWLVLTEQRSAALPVLQLIVVRGFLPALIIGTVAVMVKGLRDEKAALRQGQDGVDTRSVS